MACCRVYFFTYQRNYLIPRSIQSLLNQTFTDWVCEVHNDCPENDFPEKYIASLNDSRFIIKNHTINLGGTKSFNLAFEGCNEKYASILEDDNWWESDFLEEMTSVMEQMPFLDIAWCNMRIWKERDENTWEDSGKTVWPQNDNQLFEWPQKQQALGALHSIGAMIYRGINAEKYLIPNNTLLDAVELVRERAYSHPIYLYSKVLANFAVTLHTNRSKDSWKWTASQVMLISSLIITSDHRIGTFKGILYYYRRQKPVPVVNFFLMIIFYLKDLKLLKVFNYRDWLILSIWLVKNSWNLIKIKNYIKSQNDVYQFLIINTQNRYNEQILNKPPTIHS